MHKVLKYALFALLAVVFLLLLVFSKEKLTQIKEVCFQNHCFTVEVASTLAQQQRGLMFRQNLEKNNGMLFIFEKEADYPFWMKNTFIPLDMIWMNQHQEIVFIKENALPCGDNCPLIEPHQKATYVLEINARAAKNAGFALGDTITFKP